MSWTVEDRDKAIRPCDFDKQGNKNQCLNCAHSKDSGGYMTLDCVVWCAAVEYDEICDKHKIVANKGRG